MIFTYEKLKKIDHKKFVCSGVYRIYTSDCKINYVGISVNVFRRWKEHLSRGRSSGAKGLSKSLKTVNKDSLLFEVLVYCKNIDLLKLMERGYIEKYDSFLNGQNGDHGGSLNPTTREMAMKGGIACLNQKRGVHSLSKEQKATNSKIAGSRARDLGKGIHALSSEKKSKYGYLGGKTSRYIWKIRVGGITHTSQINEGLENLCKRVNFPYRKAVKVFYEYEGFHKKSGVKVSRITIENSVKSVELREYDTDNTEPSQKQTN